MRDTRLGGHLGKQFSSKIRPHFVGPDPRAKLFATRSIFLQEMIRYLQSFLIIPAADTIFKMAANFTHYAM